MMWKPGKFIANTSHLIATLLHLQWKKHHDLPTRCMRAHSLQYCLLYIHTPCLKVTEKVSFNIASEASNIYILSDQELLIKNTKNGQFGKFLKMRHLDDFQTLCIQSPFYVRLISLYAALLWDFWPSHRDWRPEEKKICSRQLHWGQEDPQDF